jgi:hypothetical protein
MEDTAFIFPDEMERYADRIESRTLIPELISKLVKQSVPDVTLLRIPFGNAVGLPGNDGLVETVSGFLQWVPKGISYWEIGTGGTPQAKATEEYKKRTAEMSPESRSLATFVFVTPRSQAWDIGSQRAWIEARRAQGWGGVKILDGIQICDWLREFPGVARWFLRSLGIVKSGSGLRTPSEHWDTLANMSGVGAPPLPPELFLVGREAAVDHLERFFALGTQQLLFSAESENDVDDFVAAFLASKGDPTGQELLSRCLFVSEPDVLQYLNELRESHFIVASSRLDLTDAHEQLHAAARRRGHRIVIPVSGFFSGPTDELIQLRSPSRSDIDRVLKTAGFDAEKAAACASAGTLSAMKRLLRGVGAAPPYATWANAQVFMSAQLVGRWNESSAGDRKAVELLSGKPYGEWIQKAREDSLRADTPLVQRNGVWRILARQETWTALGPRISDDDLIRFEEAAVLVLSEIDPRVELSKHGPVAVFTSESRLSHSNSIREGIAESLALLGAKPDALTSTSLGMAEGTARGVVRKLLTDASWLTWASLHRELPLLAEAAPGEFLDAMDSALADVTSTPFLDVFRHEGGAGVFGGWNYMSGVLWALETLAWHPDYFGRATLILADLAEIDPGGSWSNRPKNSLVDVFLPWIRHSMADLNHRKAAIIAILKEHPEVAWHLLLKLLPSAHGTSTGTRKPTWRNFVPDGWREGVTVGEYEEQIQAYSAICTELAGKDFERLATLVDRIPDLPEMAQAQVLSHITSSQVTCLTDEQRFPLWESLVDLAHKHRRYGYTNWAMESEKVERLEAVAELIKPKSKNIVLRRLFTEGDFDLYEDNDDFEEQRKLLELRRRDAVSDIYDFGGASAVLEFGLLVESPGKVGTALGDLPIGEVDKFLVPSYLTLADHKLKMFVGGFVWRRYWVAGLAWAKELLTTDWSAEQKLAFLISLPAERQVWEWSESVLGGETSEYWLKAPINPWGMESPDLLEVAEKLTASGNAARAIDCLYLLAHKKNEFPIELGHRVLIQALQQPDTRRPIDSHHAAEAISWLQTYTPLGSDLLFQIEWLYLDVLHRMGGGGAPLALEHRLGSVPAFFCEVIAAVFRSDKDDASSAEPVSEEKKAIGRRAYSLLHGWRNLPGSTSSGVFDADAFTKWLQQVKELARASGHYKIAMDQIGQALAYAPPDPDGLWLHRTIATELNARDVPTMRSAFRVGLANKRGVHGFSQGKEEQAIARGYREKAAALDAESLSRLADEVRALAEQYEATAERESQRDIFD